MLKHGIICSIIGVLFYAYQSNWIVVFIPSFASKQVAAQQIPSMNKKVTLHWWYDAAWHSEQTDIVWPADTASALERLVQRWLTLLDEEKTDAKKIVLESLLLSTSGSIAFISFDRSPLKKQASLYENMMWIEGLYATIQANGFNGTHIQLLVNHQPLVDQNLDFSEPWPIAGFMRTHKA